MNQYPIIVIHSNNEFVEKLKLYLPKTITILEKVKISILPQKIRFNLVSCVILFVECLNPDRLYFENFIKNFQNIPCIAILIEKNIELARFCGAIGVDSVIMYDVIDRIGDEIVNLCARKNSLVGLSDLLIDKENKIYSSIVKKALLVIEQNFKNIEKTNAIAKLIEVSESTLSREFAKYNLPGPKKILMYLKAHQAIRLMFNKGLNLKEISFLSGFTNEKRMAECFHRIYGIPPGVYRFTYVKK